MTKPRLRLVAPTTENRTVTPRRPKNGDLRTREHLTIDEVERLIEAAKDNRYGHRDALMVLLAFRHGLRAGEVVDLRCGTKSTSKLPACTSGGLRAARAVTSARVPNRPSCSSQSAARHSQRPDSPGWSSAQRF